MNKTIEKLRKHWDYTHSAFLFGNSFYWFNYIINNNNHIDHSNICCFIYGAFTFFCSSFLKFYLIRIISSISQNLFPADILSRILLFLIFTFTVGMYLFTLFVRFLTPFFSVLFFNFLGSSPSLIIHLRQPANLRPDLSILFEVLCLVKCNKCLGVFSFNNFFHWTIGVLFSRGQLMQVGISLT